jgi:hypothetical protein
MRLDFSLVGYSKLKSKRRNMSVLFKEVKNADGSSGCEVYLLNRDKNHVLNPFEAFDEEEKLAMITDMLNSQPMQVNSDVAVNRNEWVPIKSMFGKE